MDTVTLSSEGQLVIPSHFRKALHLSAGDKVAFHLEGEKLVLQRESTPPAKLVTGQFGRRVLVAPKTAPELTVEVIRSLRDDN